MKNIQRRLAIISTCLAFGCAPAVKQDYDPSTDFSRLKTYAWRSPKQQADTRTENSLMETRVRNAVDREMAEKKYRKAAHDEADFVVTYHYIVTQEIDTNSGPRIGLGAGSRGTFGGVSFGVGGSESKEIGTLTLDIMSPDGKLLWRGDTRQRFTASTPEKTTEKIKQAVAAILAKFPPGR